MFYAVEISASPVDCSTVGGASEQQACEQQAQGHKDEKEQKEGKEQKEQKEVAHGEAHSEKGVPYRVVYSGAARECVIEGVEPASW